MRLDPACIAGVFGIAKGDAWDGPRLEFLFETLSMHKAHGMVFSRNMASVYNRNALGFQYEGLLREARKARDGGRHDLCMFGLLRDEWRARVAERST